MAQQFNSQGFLLRFIFALILVFVTYNPSGYSYYHWASDIFASSELSITPPFALISIILLIGWTVYLRATVLKPSASKSVMMKCCWVYPAVSIHRWLLRCYIKPLAIN